MLQRLVNKKMLEGMFGDTFNISLSEFKSMTVCDISTVIFSFITNGIPQKVPEKWSREKYNAISFCLKLSCVKELCLKGAKTEFFSIPKLYEDEEDVFFEINEDFFNVFCKAEFLYITEITPYLDERWD